ncbi:hypothetical protein ACHAPO_008237 [Fusarium lateritium]
MAGSESKAEATEKIAYWRQQAAIHHQKMQRHRQLFNNACRKIVEWEDEEKVREKEEEGEKEKEKSEEEKKKKKK